MPTIEILCTISAPPQKVWDFVSDIEKGPEWVTVMQKLVSTTANPLTEGAVYRERSKIGPSESETEWRVTRFDPPKIQVHECSEPTLKARLTLKVEPAGDGARLTHRTEYRLMPRFRPLGWLAERLFAHSLMTRNMQTTVDNAKRMIESEA